MRFYLKLGLIVAACVGIQCGIDAYDAPLRRFCFGLQCLLAKHAANEQLTEHLVQQARIQLDRDCERLALARQQRRTAELALAADRRAAARYPVFP